MSFHVLRRLYFWRRLWDHSRRLERENKELYEFSLELDDQCQRWRRRAEGEEELPPAGRVDCGHRVKIVADDPSYSSARVWIDGEELRLLTEVKTRIAVPETNRVAVEFEPESLDIEVLTREVQKEPV